MTLYYLLIEVIACLNNTIQFEKVFTRTVFAFLAKIKFANYLSNHLRIQIVAIATVVYRLGFNGLGCHI